jgi:hypothetical protein
VPGEQSLPFRGNPASGRVRNDQVTLLRSLLVLAAAAHLGSVAWALQGSGAFDAELARLLALPWGVVSLVDLYVGFVAFAVVICLTERTWLARLGFALPLFVIGFAWGALWLAWRLPQVAQRLGQVR